MAREDKGLAGKPAKSGMQLTRTSQYGLVVLAVLLGLQGLRMMSERVDLLAQDTNRAAAELAAMTDGSGDDTWIDRARSAEAASQLWSQLAWAAPAPGIAAAELEATLRSRLTAQAFSQLQVEVNPEPVQEGQISYLRFTISGEMVKNRAHSLFADLASSKPYLRVTSLRLSKRGASSFLIEVSGIAPYLEER